MKDSLGFDKIYQKGDILKLSREGIDWLSFNFEKKRDELAKLRFEFRCISRGDSDCITVITNSGKGYHVSYHKDFLGTE